MEHPLTKNVRSVTIKEKMPKGTLDFTPFILRIETLLAAYCLGGKTAVGYMVYDVSLKSKHAFWSNGFISHNTYVTLQTKIKGEVGHAL